MSRFRNLVFLALFAPLLVSAADKTPPQLEPLPEPPPPPPGYEPDPATEPQVTITKKGSDTIEEYRMGGELYMMKVTPSHGKSYYLVKETANGEWMRKEGPAEGMSIPQWVIFRF